MNDRFRGMNRQRVRTTDSNTLLRLYDAAREQAKAPSSMERDKAERALVHIRRELHARLIRL